MWCLEARKRAGSPYGGTWQVRRAGLWPSLATWWDERLSRAGSFDAWRLTWRRVTGMTAGHFRWTPRVRLPAAR